MFGGGIGLWAGHKFKGDIGLARHKKVAHTGSWVGHRFAGHIE